MIQNWGESSYIVLLKVTKVSNNTNPHQHGGCSKKDAADIIVGQALQSERVCYKIASPAFLNVFCEQPQ